MSSAQQPIRPHPDIQDVGDEGSRYRIPGAADARTGHHFAAVDPLAPNQPRSSDVRQEQASASSERRPEEHLPPSTGRDRPPAGLDRAPPGRDRPPTGTFVPSTKNGTARVIPGDSAPPSDQVGLPPISSPVFDADPFEAPPRADETLTGATTKDVDQPWVIGHPSHGMTSKELRHDGKQHRKRTGGDTTQYGPQGGELDE